MLGFIQRFAFIGLVIQNAIQKNVEVSADPTAIVANSLLLIFYIPAIYMAFLGYREFKAMMFEPEAPQGGAQGGAPGGNYQRMRGKTRYSF